MNNRTVSLLPQNSIGKYGPQDSEKASVGTPLKIVDFDDIITTCRNPKAKSDKKHQFGAIIAYVQDKLGVTDESVSGGIIFCDIDNISKQVAKDIYDHFDDIASQIPFLYACCYSSSYTISSDHAGLHFFCYSDVLTRYEYTKYASVCLCTIAAIIKKILHYDLDKDLSLRVCKDNDGNPKRIIDTHNCSIAQKLYLFYDDFHVNPYATSITEIQYNQLVKQLEKDYAHLIKKDDVEVVSMNSDVEITGTCNKKKELHYGQDYPIANYLASTQKYTEKQVLDIMLSIESRDANSKKSNGSNTIAKHFSQIIRTAFSKYNSTGVIKESDRIKAENILKEVGFSIISNTNNDGIEISENRYLSDDENYKIIIDFYNNHNKMQLVSGTGTGKTMMIRDRLVKELNAIIIYPYNALSELYKNKMEDGKVSGVKLYMPSVYGCDNYTDKEPICMVYDQFVKLVEEGLIDKDRPIIVDESHCLFFEQGQGFRKACVRCMYYLREFSKVILVSATPCCELKCIGVDDIDSNTITFYKKRSTVNFTFCYEKSSVQKYGHLHDIQNIMVNTAYHYASKKTKYHGHAEKLRYDHVLILTDSMYETIKDNIRFKLTDDAITSFRSDDKNKPEIVDLLTNELIRKQILITTKVGNNALNYKNKNERILILLDFKEHDTPIQEVVQKIGRIRFSNVDCMCFLDKVPESRMSVSEKRKYNLIKQEYSEKISEKLLHIDDSLNDEQVYQAALQVEEYIQQESTIENLFEYLKQTGYINISQRCYDVQYELDEKGNLKLDKNGKPKIKASRCNMMKKHASDVFKEKLKSDTLFDLKYSENDFIQEWYTDIENILNTGKYNIDKQSLYNFITSHKENTLMSTILDKFFCVYECCYYDDDSFNKQMKCFDDFISFLNKEGFTESAKNQFNKKKTYIRYRNKYKNIFDNESFVSVISFMIDEFNEEDLSSRKIMSDKKKKPFKIKNKVTGEVLKFDSNESCASFFKTNISTVKRFKNGSNTIVFTDYKLLTR